MKRINVVIKNLQISNLGTYNSPWFVHAALCGFLFVFVDVVVGSFVVCLLLGTFDSSSSS